MKTCAQCGESFEPAKPYYWICPECWDADRYAALESPGIPCGAVTPVGAACKNLAMRGHRFCHVHLRMVVYGFFDQAVALDRPIGQGNAE